MFRIAPKTVTRTLARQGAPHFRLLKGLGVLLHALELETRFGLKRRQAAKRLGLRDGSALSRLSGYWAHACTEDAQPDPWCELLTLYDHRVLSTQHVSPAMLASVGAE